MTARLESPATGDSDLFLLTQTVLTWHVRVEEHVCAQRFSSTVRRVTCTGSANALMSVACGLWGKPTSTSFAVQSASKLAR
jgi:hypothetical protein